MSIPAVNRHIKQVVPEDAQNQYAMNNTDQPDVQTHVSVENVTELVCYHTLQFSTRQSLRRPSSHPDDRVVRRITGRKRIDARFIKQVYRGCRYP